MIGIGGLGHFAIMLGYALGAEVTAISHNPRKEANTRSMGDREFLVSGGENWEQPHSQSFDFIICTSFAPEMPLEKYILTLNIGGTLVYVGILESNLLALLPTLMIGNTSALRGSNTGSKKEAISMLKLVADKEFESWVEEMPMSDCNLALQKLRKGDARYRIVLKSDGSL